MNRCIEADYTLIEIDKYPTIEFRSMFGIYQLSKVSNQPKVYK